MSLHNRVLIRAVTACWILAGSFAARAQEAFFAGTNPPPKFSVKVQKGEVVRDEQVQRAMIRSGQHQFLVVVPHGMRADVVNNNTMILEPKEGAYTLMFRMTGKSTSEFSTAEACRRLVSERFEHARILEQFALSSGGETGPAFDLSWPVRGYTNRFVRVAFIPSPAGMLEFSLVSDYKDLVEGEFSFNGLIGGFRTNAKGEIEIIYYSDNS